ncbi:hypothetical protein PVAP13_9KG165926 [Panicum virgatum]|uniref:Uncharacterized protein n=1 Tax=Panicum virgatum TaxID=38727 RepID=A0A8T0NLU7_PANVG|nr:hypothetical protein PVAP13_9KG165926 [Panicum virgatum]
MDAWGSRGPVHPWIAAGRSDIADCREKSTTATSGDLIPNFEEAFSSATSPSSPPPSGRHRLPLVATSLSPSPPLPPRHFPLAVAASPKSSTQWIRALAGSPVLDFTDRNFARGQPPARAAATEGRYLRPHAERSAPLDAAAVTRGAREVNVDAVAGGRRSRERRRCVPRSPRRPVPSTPPAPPVAPVPDSDATPTTEASLESTGSTQSPPK